MNLPFFISTICFDSFPPRCSSLKTLAVLFITHFCSCSSTDLFQPLAIQPPREVVVAILAIPAKAEIYSPFSSGSYHALTGILQNFDTSLEAERHSWKGLLATVSPLATLSVPFSVEVGLCPHTCMAVMKSSFKDQCPLESIMESGRTTVALARLLYSGIYKSDGKGAARCPHSHS